MSDYKILEVTTSYREDVKKNDKSQIMTSTVDCHLVAHCLYEFGTEKEQGTCDVEVYRIATKTYDDFGNFTITPGSGTIPTYEEVEEKLKSIIEDQILIANRERLYRTLIINSLGQAESKINRYFRDSKTGLEVLSK